MRSPGQCILMLDAGPANQQVVDQEQQRHNQKQMDEAATDTDDKPQQPENDKYDEYRPDN